MREEELSEISYVSFKRLATLLYQGVKRSDPLLPEFLPFMFDELEVVDSLAESPKCVATQMRQEPEAPGRNYRNWTVRFGKLDSPVLSIPTAVRGAAGTR
jgi:hypothetical protein